MPSSIATAPAVPTPADLLTDRQHRRLERRDLYERITSSGTVAAAVMVVAALAAVVVANTDAYFAVHAFLTTPVAISFGGAPLVSVTPEIFINDFLMALFFLLVGLELKYEMTVGELTRPRQAMLPMIAAVGGVIAPATIYAVVNRGGALQGWAIPMATDIAFALGVLALLGNRVPNGVRVFFATLAIADDLISIVAIALFYGQAPSLPWLALSALVTVLLALMNKTQHYHLRPYLVLGAVLWVCVFMSGVHATIAGVVLAFCIPSRAGMQIDHLQGWLHAKLPDVMDRYDDEAHILGQHDFTHAALEVERIMHRVTPPMQRLERSISTFVNFVVLPVFAFANAQVRLVGVDLGALVVDPVTLGTYFGMLLGKPIGIFGMTFLLVKTGVASLPSRVTWGQMLGVGILGGIGFTMSILIAGLAFPAHPEEILAAKTAILAGSITAAVIGLCYMGVVCRKR